MTADLRIGEEVRVSGTAPALGCDKPERAIQMITTPSTYPLWTTREPIFLPGGQGANSVTYRYAVFVGGVFSRWEGSTPVAAASTATTTNEKINRRTLPSSHVDRKGSCRITSDVLDIFPNDPTQDSSSISRQASPGPTNKLSGKASESHASVTTSSEVRSFKSRQFEAWEGRCKNAQNKEISAKDRVVVVSYFLPIVLSKTGSGQWSATWDDENILSLQMDESTRTMNKISWVGTVRYNNDAIPSEDEQAVTDILIKMRCYPVYIDHATHHKFYDIFCKQHLWMILHHVADVYGPLNKDDIGAKAQQDLWFTYSTVNRMFKAKVVEAFSEGDLVWIHGFHLMLLPSFIRRVLTTAKIGYFMHTSFPSSEIWRTMSRREDLLRGILAADQVGFHLYEYARHFMITCHRVLGHRSDMSANGILSINVDERDVAISCIHVGIDMPKVTQALTDQCFLPNWEQWRSKFNNKVVVGGIDRLERLKGIPLKLIAIDAFLEENPNWHGKISFSIIGISATERGDDYRITLRDVKIMVKAINSKYSTGPGDIVVHFEEKGEKEFHLGERLAYFGACNLLMITATRDGLNRLPMEFTLARDAVQEIENKGLTTSVHIPVPAVEGGISADDQQMIDNTGATETEQQLASQLQEFKDKGKNMVILSEFISCARVMRGSLTVNPWRVQDVKKALTQALEMDTSELVIRHKRNVHVSSSMTTQTWAVQVLNDLKGVETKTDSIQGGTLALGFGMGFKVMGMSSGFKPVDPVAISRAYRAARSRLIVLDWGGTLVADDDKTDKLRAFALAQGRSSRVGLSPLQTKLLEKLAGDIRNNLFILSGKELIAVSEYFGHIRNVGLGAEHGFYYRWPRDEFMQAGEGKDRKNSDLGVSDSDDSDFEQSLSRNQGVKCKWQTLTEIGDQTWKESARLIMKIFVQRTHGTYVEEKGNALIWQYRDADPEFGFLQSKELEEHLKEVLRGSKEVEVIRGGGVADGYIEVRPAGVSKGLFLEHALASLKDLNRAATFVLAIGDDSSDEPMFEQIQRLQNSEGIEAFGITVGKKHSAAGSYVDDPTEVMALLGTLSRLSVGDNKFFSSVDLPSQVRRSAGITAQKADKARNAYVQKCLQGQSAGSGKKVAFSAIDSVGGPVATGMGLVGHRAMSVNDLSLASSVRSSLVNPNNANGAPTNGTGRGFSRTLSQSRLTMTGYLNSINDNDEEGDNAAGIFF